MSAFGNKLGALEDEIRKGEGRVLVGREFKAKYFEYTNFENGWSGQHLLF